MKNHANYHVCITGKSCAFHKSVKYFLNTAKGSMFTEYTNLLLIMMAYRRRRVRFHNLYDTDIFH